MTVAVSRTVAISGLLPNKRIAKRGHSTYLVVLVCLVAAEKIRVEVLQPCLSGSEYHRMARHEQGCSDAT